MNNVIRHFLNPSLVRSLIGAVALTIGVSAAHAAEPAGEFSKGVIDLGIVVKDPDRSAAFLTNAIGFKEVRGFSVTGDLGRKIGLIDGHPVNVRVFTLDEGDHATRVKVLSFPNAPSQQPDQKWIHSTIGMSYLTLYVKDVNRALQRLKQADVKLLGETPVDLGGGTWLVAVKDPDGNFVELIGPKK